MTEHSAGLPSQNEVIELLDGEFARAGYEIEDVIVDPAARPPRITVVADGDDGLDLASIAQLSRTASALLDALDARSAPYVLEVTSPGVDRPLTVEKHYRRARGRKKLAHVPVVFLTAHADDGAKSQEMLELLQTLEHDLGAQIERLQQARSELAGMLA